MNIKLGNYNIDLSLYGFSTEMHYEKRNKTALNLDLTKPTATEMIELFYCVVLANLEMKKLDLISLTDFVYDLYEQNEGDMTVLKFYKWYVQQRNAQNESVISLIKEDEEKEDKATKKK